MKKIIILLLVVIPTTWAVGFNRWELFSDWIKNYSNVYWIEDVKPNKNQFPNSLLSKPQGAIKFKANQSKNHIIADVEGFLVVFQGKEKLIRQDFKKLQHYYKNQGYELMVKSDMSTFLIKASGMTIENITILNNTNQLVLIYEHKKLIK